MISLRSAQTRVLITVKYWRAVWRERFLARSKRTRPSLAFRLANSDDPIAIMALLSIATKNPQASRILRAASVALQIPKRRGAMKPPRNKRDELCNAFDDGYNLGRSDALDVLMKALTI